MVLTNDERVAETARSIANQGRAPNTALGTYEHARWGSNYRLTDLGAAIGLAQLPKLEGWTRQRRGNAQRLNEGLARVVATPVEREGNRHVYHQYTVRVPHRDRFLERMKKAAVGAGVYYPKVLYQYEHLAPFARRCPQAEKAAQEVVSLPVHPALTDADLDRVISVVKEVVA